MPAEINHNHQPLNQFLDQMAVADILQRERLARDNSLWDEMESYYHPDSFIDISWFNGSGAEFVAQSRRLSGPGTIVLHMLSPSIVNIRGDRAIAETPCTMRNFFQHDRIDVSYEGVVRLHTRAQRLDGSCPRWWCRWPVIGLP
jgi:hypothetical protein